MSAAKKAERFVRFAAGIIHCKSSPLWIQPRGIIDARPSMANNHKRIVGFAEMLAIGQSTEAGREIFDEALISGKFERVRGSQKKRH